MVGRQGKSKAGGSSSYEFQDDDSAAELIEIGKQLLGLPKSKDALFKLLKKAGTALETEPQGNQETKLAIGELAKAVGRRELVKHKDKEVRLYTAHCLCQVLRIHAPETPYTDDQLKDIFGLFNAVYGELEDSSSAHFQLCLSVFETASQVRYSVLLLDLGADDLVTELFSTVFGAITEENASIVEPTALELLGVMLDECGDDISQALLDAVLVNLLPREQHSAAAKRLAKKLLQRCEATVQPHLQKFLTSSLMGMRTDSELKDDCHALLFELYQVVPQVLLPVLPHLSEELSMAADAKRLAATDLLGRLFSQPGSADILREYSDLYGSMLSRLHDQKVDVRLKVLGYCKGLLENCTDATQRTNLISGLKDRLMDVDERVRCEAVRVLCELLAVHPGLAGSGGLLDQLLNRLRDKKAGVRREVASQVVGLFRSWVLRAQQKPAGTLGGPSKQLVVAPLLVLLNLTTRDKELGGYVMAGPFRAGIFPPKLPLEAQVEWWAYLWRQGGEMGRGSFAKLLRHKYHLQKQVKELLQLRDAAKERRLAAGGGTSSLAGSGTGAGAAAAPAATSSMQHRPASSLLPKPSGDPEKDMQHRLQTLARSLGDTGKTQEGLVKLFEMKDNHIFRGLAALAAYGMSLEAATATGKDVVQRVGSKGAAGEVARALVAGLSPSLISPELLQAAMRQAGESQEAQQLLADVAAIAPQLFAQSLDPLLEMLEQDDPLLSNCAVRVLAKAGRYLADNSERLEEEAAERWHGSLDTVELVLVEMCGGSAPRVAKAAVQSLAAVLPQERAQKALRQVAEAALDVIKPLQGSSPSSAFDDHPRLLTAIKVLSAVGRVVPALFASSYAAELADFVLEEVLERDLSTGKPLRPVTEDTGEQWGRPSPAVEMKAAAIKTLAQAFVPDYFSGPAAPREAVAGTVRKVVARLVGLVNPDPEAEEFEGIGIETPADAGWVRAAASSGMLRLARAQDWALDREAFVELALSLQDPLPEARRLLARKVVRLVEYFQTSRMSSKYAALLGMLAVDPMDENQGAAFMALYKFVQSKRQSVAKQAQETADAGGGGGSVETMPEFLLPYFLYVLAHHPDYPSPEELQQWADMDEEERAEMEDSGQGHPLDPFQTMLQFVLEPLVLPAEHPTSPAEIAQTIPATLKLLRSLKVCSDQAPEDTQRTENVHQLCDMAMALVRALVRRVVRDKEVEPRRFPGSVAFPAMFFKPIDLRTLQNKRPEDGSALPPAFLPVLTEDLFSQRFVKLHVPGERRGHAAKGRSKQRARAVRSGSEAGGGEEAAAGDEATSPPMVDDEGEDEELPGSGSKPRGKRGKPAGADDDAAAPAPKRKRPSPGSAEKKRKRAEPKPKEEKPATRHQPRRGAKTEAAAKLQAPSDEEEESESGGEGSGEDAPAPGPSSAVAAAASQQQSALQTQQRPPPPPQQGRRGELWAHSEDEEEEEWSDDAEDSGGGPSGRAGGEAQQKQPPPQQQLAKPARGAKGAAAKGAGAQAAAALGLRSKNVRA